MNVQLTLFDYDSLDAQTREFVQEKAQAIHARLKRTAEDIIAIGQDLIEVKARLQHGQFLDWLDAEFGMNVRSAQRFMQVAERLGKNDKLSYLPVSVLYELAAPSTPDTVVEMVETGQIAPTLPAIREARQEVHVLPSAPEPEPEPASHFMQLMSSSETPEWYTPLHIVDRVVNLFGEIDLDPCSNSHDAPNIPAKRHYTKEDNGLSQPWQGRVYMNPPYGDEIPQWTKKLLEEYISGRVEEAVALVPGRVDTLWFQPFYAHPMCYIRGRLKFIGAPHSAPFPSIAVYLGKRHDAFIEAFKDIGPIMGRAEETEEVTPQPEITSVPSEEQAEDSQGIGSLDDTANDSTGDPLCDAINQLMEAAWMFDLIEDDWYKERLLKDVQEAASRWMYIANKRVLEEVQEVHV